MMKEKMSKFKRGDDEDCDDELGWMEMEELIVEYRLRGEIEGGNKGWGRGGIGGMRKKGKKKNKDRWDEDLFCNYFV